MTDPYLIVLEALEEDNPQEKYALLQACANWIVLHVHGTDNVRRYGAQVLHPKSGAPIENPWLKTISTAEKSLFGKSMAKIKKDNAFRALQEAMEEEKKE